MKRITWIAAFVIVALIAIPAVALAQDGDPGTPVVTDDDVNAVANQLYCPVCENVPLDVCGTQACADWRGEIRTMLQEGRSEQEIFNYFTDRYGQRVLATPEARGFNLIVWIVPPLAVIIGIVVLVGALRRMAPSAIKADQAALAAEALRYDNLDPEIVARIEADLHEFSG